MAYPIPTAPYTHSHIIYPVLVYMPRALAPAPAPAHTLTFPSHQGNPDRWVAPDTSEAWDAYTPMANGLSLISNGYGFYEALAAPPYPYPYPYPSANPFSYTLCKPQTAAAPAAAAPSATGAANDDIDLVEYQPELNTFPSDHSRTTRFFSPGESPTPPGTPASTAVSSAPSPSTPTSTSTSTLTFRSDRYPSPPPLSSTATATTTATSATAMAMATATSTEAMSISTEDARQLIEAYVRRATWFHTNAMEPAVGEPGVPPCALLLARPGESVYRCFVDTRKDRDRGGGGGKPVYYCVACGFKSDRLHRLIGHQRSKRGHRPFACPDQGCDFRGYSAESLGDHRSTRNGLQTCEWCGDTIIKKNMTRHLQLMHAHSRMH